MLFQYYPAPAHNYKYELHKDMNFSAAHFIPAASAGQCARMHGHTYVADITVAGNELNEAGFLVNFSDLKKLIHGRYDHTLLNDHEEFTGESSSEPERYPTTEVLARQVWETVEAYLQQFPNKATCLQVLVRETPTSYVIYRP
ncbi:6-carboxy-5,6,7,8-tetrahydropterin synthase [Paenibacillus swuensis]|uniref:6-carboxy-5,6,7,8-tetrahydropterin synthase n=1 Tax=Paenibacillus swuensis TaxID=1178515 RepID=A0A172TML4_9BACL|nr:6-pyruvoyl tetrahydropterin synthase family protein [Paenibacillus swuensis]ANE48144.1 6-carboxy-5,6,7,8-tetrahydropterin synthase [Paenibacillus swuensis]